MNDHGPLSVVGVNGFTMTDHHGRTLVSQPRANCPAANTRLSSTCEGERMRRIVTGTTTSGRSTIISDDHIDGAGMTSIWTTTGHVHTDRAHVSVGFEATPGGASWTTVRIPPEAIMRAALATGVPGVDADGWHTTDTTDLVYVVDGRVFLALDTQEVELVAGDCVVQQGTRHAWWNRTDDAVQILSVSISPPER